jgi:GH24 family phage-related lysozyme (muramidase)
MKGIENEIRKHEGFVDGFYLDSRGKLTSGYGHLVNLKTENVPDEVLNLLNKFNKDPRVIEAEKKVSKAKTEEEKSAAKAAREKVYKKVSSEINEQDFGMKAIKSQNGVASFEVNYKVDLDEIEQDFKADVAEKGIARAQRNFPDFDKYPENVQRALINMSYQLGNSPASWPSFNAALNYGLKTGDFSHAAYHASDSQWFENQTPKRAKEVVAQIGSIAKEPLSKKEMDSYVAPPEPRPEREEEKIDIKLDVPEILVEAPEIPSLDFSELDETLRIRSENDFFNVPEMQVEEQVEMPELFQAPDRIPTNPEAGPSDTVPAMLTEGEAVIPAAAAQNPENKQVIQELLVEGRTKNDIAEANGVPVTSQKLAELPKERLYDNVELDEYHRRNLTGKYGGGERSLKGFAGGTMEVPALMMMIPPSPEKDPTMDAMEKLAVKQMAYEQKSKNRTRDTVEKIGLKHLEETATADMRQAALDETMKNYGMEVPMPMGAPPAQGFEDGSPVVTGDSLYSITQDLYQPEETRRQAEAMRREQFPDHIGEGEIIPVSDPRYKPPMPVNEEQIAKNRAANLGYDPRLAEQADAEIGSFAVPEQFKVEPASTISTEGTKGQEPTKPTTDKTEGGFLSGLGKAFGKAFMGAAKRVFAPEALAQGAIYYGVNKLLGYNDQTAAQQAMLGYGDAQKQIAADEKYLRDLGIKNLEVQRKRDESANKNRGALYTFGEGVVSDTLADLGVDNKDMNATKAFITQEALSRIDNLGLDMSTEAGLQSARDVMVAVTNNYATQVRQGFDNPNMSRAFDEVMLSKKAMSDAFTIQGDVPKVVSNKAVQGSLERIRRNVNADANVKDSVKQVEFENRVSRLYQLFRDNPGKVEALGLRAPSAGENEFTVFLEHILAGEQRGDTRKFNL